LFLDRAKHTPTSGPLCLLFLVSETLVLESTSLCFLLPFLQVPHSFCVCECVCVVLARP
jgi:hypothetical protein